MMYISRHSGLSKSDLACPESTLFFLNRFWMRSFFAYQN